MTNQTDNIRRGWTSASNAEADLLCPGRHGAQRGIPEPEKGPDALQGTVIHKALETGDMTGLSVEQTEVHDSCKNIEGKLVEAFFGAGAPVVAFRHKRYWCKIQVNLPDKTFVTLEHSGEVDVVYRSGTKALILDYKTLAGDIEESPKNLQLRDLAVLVKGNDVVISEIGVAIIQPYVSHKPELCVYSNADLIRATEEMYARVDASNLKDSKRVAGELQCKFCLAKTKCQPYIAWAGTMIPTGSGDPLVKELVFQTAMENWTPAQRTIAAGLLGPAVKVVDEIKDFLKEGMAKDPNFVPGYTLTNGSKRESISDPQAAFTRFNKLGGTVDSFMRTVTVGVAKLRDEVAEVTGKKGKALDQTMADLKKDIIQTSITAPSIKKLPEVKA